MNPDTRTLDGLLPCTCWCEVEVVRVSPEEIKAGRTESCGSARCRPPAAAA